MRYWLIKGIFTKSTVKFFALSVWSGKENISCKNIVDKSLKVEYISI